LPEGITIALDNSELLSGVCGANDGNLKIIESILGGFITARGNEIHFESGDTKAIDLFKNVIENLVKVVQQGDEPSHEYIRALMSSTEPNETIIQIPNGFRRVYPHTKNQAGYIRAMRDNDISFCIGPAGTGKTFLAIAQALSFVLSKKLRKLVLTRPVVEAGENLGFLPGDLSQKINPYLRPLYDAMESLVPYEVIRRMEDMRSIEIAPLAYMRGRSLNDCMIILDEAQNTTREQMKMFLTRIGQGARAVITGDSTQIDLPRKTDSGLLHAMDILKNIDGLSFTYLHTTDVARNPLIKKIIQAYNENKL
jgi:phosphate starvation-inducible PhoH-like protein